MESSRPRRVVRQGTHRISASDAADKAGKNIFIVIWLTFVAIPILGVWYIYETHSGLEWWQTTIVYQVYPRSFQDTDGDGVGDLAGITSRLDHFDYINVHAMWLSPFYESPMKDFGYDVSNHTKVDPIFGTLQDFNNLVEESHKTGIKVIVDFIPNHTSDKHKWFIESRKSKADSNPYRDYFVWHDGKKDSAGKRIPPNNWISIFGGSAWEWDDTRKQYYLHQFIKEQPDLNWTNPEVQQEMMNVLRFWLDRGVDGFRVDAVLTLFEDPEMRDEPRSKDKTALTNQHEYLDHIYTLHLPEVYDVVATWKELLDEYEEKDKHQRFMVTEAYSKNIDHITQYYFFGAVPFNFDLVMVDRKCGGMCFHDLVDRLIRHLPKGKWPNFVIGNHDRQRVAARMGSEFVDVMNMLLLLLPGTPTTYYGEEIGMEPIQVSFEDTQDPWGKFFGKENYEKFSRDPSRSPMLWSGSKQAGFSLAEKTWLPVHPEYRTNNVEFQKHMTKYSHLKLYRKLALLREDPIFQSRDLEYAVVTDEIFSFVRKHGEQRTVLVALNIGHKNSIEDYSGKPVRGTLGDVMITTNNMGIENNQRIDLRKIELKPGQGIVLDIVPGS